MHPFSVGDLVECIDDCVLPGRVRGADEDWVGLGKIYRVSELVTSDQDECGVQLAEIAVVPPQVGWHAWRFQKLTRADDSFCELMASLSLPLATIEQEIIQCLDGTSCYEGRPCTYVPGMASEFSKMQYQTVFGPPPIWVKALHPVRRTKLYSLAMDRREALPKECPRPNWLTVPSVTGEMHLVADGCRVWVQPTG